MHGNGESYRREAMKIYRIIRRNMSSWLTDFRTHDDAVCALRESGYVPYGDDEGRWVLAQGDYTIDDVIVEERIVVTFADLNEGTNGHTS